MFQGMFWAYFGGIALLGKNTSAYNHFYNILRLFDVLSNFPFTTNEMMHDYYFQTRHIRVASRVAERQEIRKYQGSV